MTFPFDLSPMAALYLGVALFLAAILRGYSGFAFSALVVIASGLVSEPLNFVPAVVFLEVVLSLQVLRSIGPEVDLRRVALLALGVLAGLPLGLWALTRASEDVARLVIAAFILLMCLLLRAGGKIAQTRGLAPNLAVGIGAGAANAAGMGGMPVAAFFAAQSLPAAVFRATLVGFFPLLDGLSLPLYWAYGMITPDSFWAALFALPPALLGNALGAWAFRRSVPRDFRGLIIAVLALLALVAILKSSLNLLG